MTGGQFIMHIQCLCKCLHVVECAVNCKLRIYIKAPGKLDDKMVFVLKEECTCSS